MKIILRNYVFSLIFFIPFLDEEGLLFEGVRKDVSIYSMYRQKNLSSMQLLMLAIYKNLSLKQDTFTSCYMLVLGQHTTTQIIHMQLVNSEWSPQI